MPVFCGILNSRWTFVYLTLRTTGTGQGRKTLAVSLRTDISVDKILMTKNIMIKLETGHYNMTPFGFHKYASDYFVAADTWTKNIIKEGYSPVPYFLYSRSIELGLKAYLLAKKQSLTTVIKCNHDLIKALNKAKLNSLDSFVITSSDDEKHITLANNIYSKKGFEYFYIINHVTGKEKFPNISVLHDYSEKLLKNIKVLTDNTEI